MSNNKETRYLYSKENGPLYLGILEEQNNAECMYSRNLIAVMEGQSESMSAFYDRHVVECKICQDIAQATSWRSQRVRQLIPSIRVPTELSSQIRSELKDALRLQNRVFDFNKDKKKFRPLLFLKTSLRDVFGNKLILKFILQGLLLALLIYFLLQWTV